MFYFGWNLLGSALSFLNPLSHILQTQSEGKSAIFTHFATFEKKAKKNYFSDFWYLILDLLKGSGSMLLLGQLCLKLFHRNFSFSSLSGSRALFLHINHSMISQKLPLSWTIYTTQTWMLLTKKKIKEMVREYSYQAWHFVGPLSALIYIGTKTSAVLCLTLQSETQHTQ